MFEPSSQLHSRPAATALTDLLASGFDLNTRKRGKSYVARRAVLETWEDESDVFGYVQGSESEPYMATLTYDGRSWSTECECPVGVACKHAYALGQVWLTNNAGHPTFPSPNDTGRSAGPIPPTGIKPKSFRELWTVELAERIGRKLTDEEGRLLGQLSALFHEFRNQGQLPIYLLQRHGFAVGSSAHHHNSWQPAFPGWWSNANAPENPWQLWQYIACHWEMEGRLPPAAFASMTHTGPIKAAVARLLLQQEIEPWQRPEVSPRLHNFSEPLHVTYPELRLKLQAGGTLHFEVRVDPQKPWRVPTQQWLKELGRAGWAELQGYSPASQRLATALRLTAEYHQIHIGRAGVVSSDLLPSFIDEPAPNSIVFLPDDEPFRIEPSPLQLVAREIPNDPDRLHLEWLCPDGEVHPASLQPLIEQPEPLYLINHRVWRGPPAPPSHRLPIAGLEDPSVALQIKRLGIALPAKIARHFTTLALRPKLRCWIERRKQGGFANDTFHAQLTAECQNPLCAQTWRGDYRWHWLPEQQPPSGNPDTPQRYLPDLVAAQLAADGFNRLPLHFFSRDDNWSMAVTDALPDQFTDWRHKLPADLEIEVSAELAGLLDEPLRARVSASVFPDESSGTDWFDVRVALKPDDRTLTDEELSLLLAARGGWVHLPKRGWQRLTVDSTIDPNLTALGLSADPAEFLRDTTPQTHRFHALQLAEVEVNDADLTARLRERARRLQALPPPAPPSGLTATLRPYQQDGFHYLAHLATQGLGGVLADDMGLGKTVQTLAWLLWLRDQPTRKESDDRFRVLIVCPKSVVPNWQNETARFAPSLATNRIDPRQSVPADPGLLVVNYTQLRLRADDLTAIKWDAVVLDEGQNIKTPTSATAKAARALAARHRVVLTGTPIENRLLDLWSLLAFAQPGLLGTQASFQQHYNDKRDPTDARSRLATRARPFLLRRTKNEVARDLPARIEEDLPCELEGPQRTLYEAELKRARQLLLKVDDDKAFNAARFNILQSLLRLRQICCDPRLVSATKAKTSSAKLEALFDTLEPLVAEGHRVLIFSQFVQMLEIIRDELRTRGISHLMLTGQTENRQELVDTFQSAAGPPVFLLSLKAAGSGLNLTAANHVVLYDPWWNPAVEAQAIDRTHRIGQTNQVMAYRLIAKGTIEEKIRAMQREKADLAAAVVQEESLAKVMDLQTLREVLS